MKLNNGFGHSVLKLSLLFPVLFQIIALPMETAQGILLNKCNQNVSGNTTEGKSLNRTDFDLFLDQFELKTMDLPIECNETISVNTTDAEENNNNYFTTSAGFLKIGNLYINPQSYCISRITREGLTIKSCVKEVNSKIIQGARQNALVLPKCCPPGAVVSLNVQNWTPATAIHCVSLKRNESEDDAAAWKPHFYTAVKTAGNLNFENFLSQTAPNYYFDESVLENGTVFKIQTPLMTHAPKRAQIRVTEAGVIYTRPSGNYKWREISKFKTSAPSYCIDGLSDEDVNSVADPIDFKNSEDHLIMLFCGKIEPPRNPTLSITHIVLMLIASLFLCLVFTIHVLVWNTQSIHGWTVAMYSFSMFMFLVFKSAEDTVRLFSNASEGAVALIGYEPCFVIGVVLHFSHVAMFSWMTVINFDLWSTIVWMTKPLKRAEEKIRFRFYNLVGFGVPTIVVSVSIFMELYFGYFDDRVIRPQYGNYKCYLDKSSQLYYELILSLTIFGLGIFLSCITARFLIAYMLNAKKFDEGIQKNRRYKMAQMFGKTFVLLAFSWIFEIGGIIGSIHFHKSRWYVVLFDVHNWIQSIGFFWIFVCKREILQQLCRKYTCFKGLVSWLDNFEGRTFSHMNSTT